MLPPLLGNHRLQGVLDAEEDALEVDGEEVVHHLFGGVHDEALLGNAGDVAHDVDAAVVGDGLCHEGLDLGLVGDVAAHRGGLAAGVFDEAGGLFQARLVDVGEDDRGAAWARTMPVLRPMPLAPPVRQATCPERSKSFAMSAAAMGTPLPDEQGMNAR